MAFVDADQNRRARQQVLDAAGQDLRQQAWCLGVVVCGSVAAGDADAWSDIDMRIVVEVDAYQDVVSRRYEIPHKWGQVAFDEGVPRDNLAIVHFKPFFKADVFYYRPCDLVPGPYWLLPQLILHDPQGIICGIIERSKGVAADAEEPTLWHLKTKAVAAAEEVRRKILRREPISAHYYLEELGWRIMGIHQRKAGADPRLSPLKYVEHLAPADFREAILRSFQGIALDGLETALKHLGQVLIALLDATDEDLRQAVETAMETTRAG